MRAPAPLRAALAVLALLGVAPLPPALALDAESPEAAEQRKAEDLVERLKSKDLDVRRAAATEAKGEQHSLVTAALAKLVGDDDEQVRTAVREALAARTLPAGKKQAAQALAARLPRLAREVPAHTELLATIEALRGLAQPVSVAALAEGIGTKTDEEEYRARVMAIANVPDAKAIETLIDLRGKAGNRAANEQNRGAWLCRQALISAIGRDLGGDTDAWRDWWRRNGATFDFAEAAARRAEEGERGARRGGDRPGRAGMD
jgi:HEAT repeat protein